MTNVKTNPDQRPDSILKRSNFLNRPKVDLEAYGLTFWGRTCRPAPFFYFSGKMVGNSNHFGVWPGSGAWYSV